MKSGSKPIDSRWYQVTRINKETIRREAMRLVKIRVLVTVQESRGTPAFITRKKEGTARFIIDLRKVNNQNHGGIIVVCDRERTSWTT